MKINKLEVTNFRCFKHKVFTFSDQFNLLVGDNGTGKTAILDALAIGCGSFFLGIDEMQTRNIRKNDIRRLRIQADEIPTTELVCPVIISCDGTVADEQLSWSRRLNNTQGRTTTQESRSIEDIARKLQERARESGQSVILPLICHYGTGRLWAQKREQEIKTLKPSARRIGYLNCLEDISNQKQFLQWMKTMEIASLQQEKELSTLTAVKRSISNCMEQWKTVFYNVLEDDLIAIAEDGRSLPFRFLSDGVRNMLAMVADIAYRTARLNPQLKEDAPILTPGVVLIDEIDLHLHPNWQRHVVEDLKKTFPKVQFFATTHSPFIIQSLKPGELIDLDNRDGEYYNKSVEDIAEDVQGVEMPQQSERWHKMFQAAEEYYKVLEQTQNASEAEINQLKSRLDELSMPYSDEPAYHAFLKMERLARGL